MSDHIQMIFRKAKFWPWGWSHQDSKIHQRFSLEVFALTRFSEKLTSDFWPWDQGYRNLNSPEIFSRCTYHISFTQVTSQDFHKTWSQHQGHRFKLVQYFTPIVSSWKFTHLGVHTACSQLPTRVVTIKTVFYCWGIKTHNESVSGRKGKANTKHKGPKANHMIKQWLSY